MISGSGLSVEVNPNAPVGAFSADVVIGDNPLTVTFTDASTNTPTSWAWSFGDGSVSTDENPVHEYTEVGFFTVTLRATNADGSGVITKKGYIHVGEAPEAAFSGAPLAGSAPLDVLFADQSTNTPTSWHWEKNDGGGWVDFDGTPTAQNPDETFAAGTWSVRLTATNAFGSDTHTETNYIVST